MEEYTIYYMWPFMMIGVCWCAWWGLRLINYICKWFIVVMLDTFKEGINPQWMRNELACIKSKLNFVDHQYFVKFYDCSSNALISNNYMSISPDKGDIVVLGDLCLSYKVKKVQSTLTPRSISSLTRGDVEAYVELF